MAWRAIQLLKSNGLKMQSPEVRPTVVVVLGPTAVGKTGLAISLATQLNGEIVSADSRLFYRGMNIGTAKPGAKERGAIPHHLIDIADPNQTLSLVDFQVLAKEAIEQILARGRLPFLVGGTGQYIQAVVEDWGVPEQQPDERLRGILEAWGKQIGAVELHRRLSLIDPLAASRMETNNLRRSVRALEVIFHTGKLFSSQKRKGEPVYRLIKIGLTLPRPVLFERIDARIDRMVEGGLLEEVKGLLGQGFDVQLPAFSAIGYREMMRVIQGEISLEVAAILMKRATHQFVRRQANWFKLADPTIAWFDLQVSTLAEIREYIQSQLT